MMSTLHNGAHTLGVDQEARAGPPVPTNLGYSWFPWRTEVCRTVIPDCWRML